MEGGVGLPFGNFGNQVNTGFGGMLAVNYFLSENFSLGLGAGFYTFSGQEGGSSFEDYKINLNPVVLNATYILGEGKIRPMIGFESGLYRLASRFINNNATVVDARSYFGITPIAGLSFESSNNLHIFSQIKYPTIFTPIANTSLLNVNLGILFLFQK